MNNCKGFSLLEVMMALTIFSTVLILSFPLFVFIQDERRSIQQERDALNILHGQVMDVVTDNSAEGTWELAQSGTSYTVDVRQRSNRTMTICIHWDGTNGKKKERCERIRV